MRPRLEDSSDGPFSEDESDESESEGQQLDTVMITGELLPQLL